jgi:hypothetical protein
LSRLVTRDGAGTRIAIPLHLPDARRVSSGTA